MNSSPPIDGRASPASLLIIVALCIACSGESAQSDAGAGETGDGSQEETGAPEDGGDLKEGGALEDGGMQDGGAPQDSAAQPPDANAADAELRDAQTQQDASSAPAAIGPPVTVNRERLATLLYRGDGYVCRIDTQQDVSCLVAGQSSWQLMRAGPFLTAAIFGSHGCGLKSDKSIACWQFNVPSPEAPLCTGSRPIPCINEGRPPAGRYVSVSSGGEHSCAVNEAGGIVCWGADSSGAATPPAGNDFVAVDSSGTLSCALRRDGTTACWGDTSEDIQLAAPAVQVVVGNGTACVLTQAGNVDCSGWYASAIDGPAGQKRFARISMKGHGLCGLSEAGAVQCFGSSDVERYAAAPGPFLETMSGTFDVCGLRGDGVVQCWGNAWGGATK